MSHIFISYSRRDLAFAQKIVDALAANNLDTWIDWKSIPKGEDWEQEIYRGIEEADAFLFLISADSVGSQMCNKEIDHAVKNGKRILPIFIANVGDSEIYGVTEKFLHKKQKEEISRRNFIKCRHGQDDFSKAIEETRKTIHTDYEWLKYHTELQVKALKWEQKKDASRLLRGKELREAEQQLAEISSQEDPQPTKIQREYILASQRNEIRQRRQITASLGFGLAVVAILAVFAWNQRNSALNSEATAIAEANAKATVLINEKNARATAQAEANAKATALVNEESARATAQAEKSRAEINAQVALSRQLSAQSALTASQKMEVGLLLSVEAFHRSDNPQTHSSLLSMAQYNPMLKQIIFEPQASIYVVAADPSNPRKAFGAVSGSKVRLWNLYTGQALKTYQAEDNVSAIRVAPDGATAYIGTHSGSVEIWNLSDDTNLILRSDGFLIVDIVVQEDRVIAASRNGTVYAWSLDRPNQPEILRQGNSEQIYYTALSPDGNRLAFVDNPTRTIILWDLKTNLPIGKPGSGHTNAVYHIAFSPDGQRLATASADETVIVWDIHDTMNIKKTIFGGDIGQLFSVAFSPDNYSIAAGGFDNQILIWDIASQQETAYYSSGTKVNWISTLAFTSDSRSIVVGSRDDETVTVWDVRRGNRNPLMTDLWPPLPASSVNYYPAQTGVSISQSKGLIAVIAKEGWVNFLQKNSKGNAKVVDQVKFSEFELVSVQFDRDGNFLAITDEKGRIVIWDANFGQAIFEVQAGEWVDQAVLSSDGSWLAAVSETEKIVLWGKSTNGFKNPPVVLSDHTGMISDILFNVDNRTLISSDLNGNILIRQLLNPSDVVTILANRAIYELSLTPDGKYLYAGQWDGTIAILSMQKLQWIGDPVLGHSYWVTGLAVDPTGKYLASGGDNNISRVALWDIQNPEQPFLVGYYDLDDTRNVSHLEFDGSSQTLLALYSNYRDGLLYQWDASLQSWLDHNCQRAGRNFTQAEWQQYLPDEEYRNTCPQWPTGQ